MRSLASLALAAALAAPAAAAPKPSAAPERKTIDASFECATPASWYAQRRRDGVSLRGPEVLDGVASVITIRYVGPGAGEKDADAYMARQTKPPEIEVSGWRIGKVEGVVVAGRKARRLVNDTSEFAPPGAMTTVEVPMKEEHVAVPAAKGYYLLIFYAPRALYAKQRPVFAKVLASFKPKL